MSKNHVNILGNLGNDPEVRYSQNGDAVCNLSIATNKKWYDKSDKLQEKVSWHRVTVFGKQAESCGQYLSKGSQVDIVGELEYGEYTDKEGIKRYTTEIRARRVLFLGGKVEGGDSRNEGSGRERSSRGRGDRNSRRESRRSSRGK